MKELSTLRNLAESTQGSGKVRKLFDKMVDKMEMASDGIEGVRDLLQSSVLANLLRQEGFPSTESKAAKTAVEAAFVAVNKAFSELEDLNKVIGIHFDSKENKGE